MITNNRKVLLFLCAGVLLIFCWQMTPEADTNRGPEAWPIQSEVYKVQNGYGYRLWHHGKIIVQQEVVPVFQGNQPFVTHEEAQKTADLVVRKISQGEDPRISKEELEQLLINIPNFGN